MKNTLLLFLILSFFQCHAQVSTNRECENSPPIKRSEKWGTLYSNQTVRIPFIYDKLEGMRGMGSYIAYREEKAGLIDCDGKEIIPFEYAHLKNWLQPFGKQHGFYVATKQAQSKAGKKVLNDWGVINEKNQVILPFEYGYVRVIDSDLIVARADRDSVLYFFSAKGKLLFKEIGKSVSPGSSALTLWINQFGSKPTKAIYKTGKEILPKKFGKCSWTDTKHFIVSKNDYQVIIDETGKQHSPDGFKRLKHQAGAEFFFSYPDSKPKQMGVFRIGEGIIFEPQHFLEKWGDVYIVANESGAELAFWDKDGNQILPMKKYWTSSFRNMISLKHQEGYQSNFDDSYLRVEDQEVRLKGLLNKQGEIVVPLQYATISYAWKSHPIIASTKEGYVVFDAKGQQRFSKPLHSITHTYHPNLLIVGKRDQQSKVQYGLVSVDQLDKIEYK
ncbi:MAG: WG repeat-containing protein [Saprospiraceae bacterium]